MNYPSVGYTYKKARPPYGGPLVVSYDASEDVFGYIVQSATSKDEVKHAVKD